MTKYFVRNFDGRTDMGVCENFRFAFMGYDSNGRCILEYENEYIESTIHAKEENINVRVNGHNMSVDEALERIFDNIDEVRSFGLICKDNKVSIQVLMSR